LLVLIGRRWAGDGPPERSRLHAPDDFVRREVVLGLAGSMRVIPVLLDGASLPPAEALPVQLRPLLQRQALALDNSRFAEDIDRLVAVVTAGASPPPLPSPTPGARFRGRWAGWVALGGLLLTLLVAWLLVRPADLQSPVVANGRADAAAQRPEPALPIGAPVRPPVNGGWLAEVIYPWPNARHVEHFQFEGEGVDLRGTAAFLGVPRGVQDGRIEADGSLRFVTRTREVGGAGSGELVHHYHARWQGGSLALDLQTMADGEARPPVSFLAIRSSGPEPAPGH
jgi:hypothetical protein